MSLILSLLIVVLGGEQSLPGATVEQHVREALAARLAPSRSATHFDFSRPILDQNLPSGTVNVVVGAVAGRWPRAHFAVPVRLDVEGKAARTLTVWMSASDMRMSLRYAASYREKTIGKDLKVQSGTVDIVCCAGEPVSAMPPMEGVRLARTVRVGDPVLPEDFEATPIVSARELVRIEADRGAIRLAMRGTALADGEVGQHIPVRTQAGVEINARVTRKGEVVVDE